MAQFNNICPQTDHIQAVELTSNQPTVQTQSISGRRQVRSFASQFYSMKITMPPMAEADLRRVYGFLIQQQGAKGTFTIAPYNLKRVSGTQSATENVQAGAIGATTINLDTTQGKFKMGDLFKFSGHSKAYMITADQGASSTQLQFEPPLVSTVGASETVLSGSNFEMTVRLEGDKFTNTFDQEGVGYLEFDVVEVV
jgi:hypothetical protein